MRVFWSIASLVALVTLAVFGRTLGFDFVNWDDPSNVYENPHLIPQVTWQGVGYFWTHSYFELYMPVTYSLWGLCAFLGQKVFSPPQASNGAMQLPFSPVPFHALNLLCHIGNAVLVYLLLLRLSHHFEESEENISPWHRSLAVGAGALLFALHPLQAEAVSWITGANNVVSGFFCLLALNAYLSYARASTPRKGAGWFTAATLAFALALLARPSAAALPIVALVLESAVLRRSWRRWTPGLLLWAVGAGAIALVTQSGSVMSHDVVLPIWGRPFIVGDALAFYMAKLIYPVQFGVDYGRHPLREVLGHWWGYVTWLVPVVLGIILWRLRLRWPAIGALLFVATALPVLGFVPFYLHRFSTVGDRYIYLSFLGPALALCWALLVPLRRLRSGSARKAVIGAVALCLLLLAARTVFQVAVWRDSVALFQNALAVNPRSKTAYGNLGIGFAEVGDYRSALPLFERAVALDPSEAESHYHLATVLVSLGEPVKAVPEFQEAVRRNPNFEEAQFRLATTLAQLPGHTEEAIAALEQVVRLNPQRAEAHYILGVLLGSQKRYAEAETQFATVAKITPDYAEAHYNLALVRERQGKPSAEVLSEYREAARLAPTEPRYSRALAEAERRATPP